MGNIVKNKVEFIERIISNPVYRITYDINYSKLYEGCPSGIWTGDIPRRRKLKSFCRKRDKILKNSKHEDEDYMYEYKRKGDALKVANKLAKLKEIKKVRVFEV